MSRPNCICWEKLQVITEVLYFHTVTDRIYEMWLNFFECPYCQKEAFISKVGNNDIDR